MGIFFGEQRTQDGKGTTITSQKRYVEYFAQLIHQRILSCPENRSVYLRGILLHGTPHFDLNGGSDPYFFIYKVNENATEQTQTAESPPGRRGSSRSRSNSARNSKQAHMLQIYDSRSEIAVHHYEKNEAEILLELKTPFKLQGDLKFCFFDHDAIGSDDPMFHFWVNTYFFPPDDTRVTLRKYELDSACKDKHNEFFDPDFAVSILQSPAEP
eukprot:NODE_538_length_1310_cov_82.626487_g390_i0.p1 GENE.NODE_538_length_1310_cov_82.626487_g390_i0~~NODE_538_length_1310_cov_82.626487_g390_i0.p1  ORF type:complete len:213 (-),score=44.08 NODE_538_length_1310_cov_82.626487_g390_i0:670-1308(-)